MENGVNIQAFTNASRDFGSDALTFCQALCVFVKAGVFEGNAKLIYKRGEQGGLFFSPGFGPIWFLGIDKAEGLLADFDGDGEGVGEWERGRWGACGRRTSGVRGSGFCFWGGRRVVAWRIWLSSLHGEDAAFITEIAANGAGTQRFNPGGAGKLAIGTAEGFEGLLGFGEEAGIIEGHGNLVGHGLEDGDGGGVKGAGAVGLNGEGAQDAVAGDEGEGGFGAGVRQLGGGQANSIGAGFASDAGGRVGNGPADHALADFDTVLAGEHDFAGFAGASA